MRRPEWVVRCPHCAAGVGRRCTTITGRRLSIPSHDIRVRAWQDRQAAEQEAES